MEYNYEYWEREKLTARQKDLKILVNALCLSMKEKGIKEYPFTKPFVIRKCGRLGCGDIRVDKLLLKDNGKVVDMQYILCDYINDNPITRRCSIKQVLTSYIEKLTNILISENLVDASVKKSMTALADYENRRKNKITHEKE